MAAESGQRQGKWSEEDIFVPDTVLGAEIQWDVMEKSLFL